MPTDISSLPETFIVKIDALTTEGQGIARISGLEKESSLNAGSKGESSRIAGPEGENSGITGPAGESTRGLTIFCDGLLPGEEAEIRIVSQKKNYAIAECVNLITAAPERIEPFCPVYDACGGCTLQHLTYEEQLRVKREHVVSCLTRIGKQPADTIEALTRPTLGMDSPYDYRNHMQYPVGETVTKAPAPAAAPATVSTEAASTEVSSTEAALSADAASDSASEGTAASDADTSAVAAASSDAAPRDLKIGLYGKKSHNIVPHNTCRLAHPACETVRKMTERFLLEKGITGYDESTGFGFLRHLIVRVGCQTGEIMVILVVNSTPDKELTFPVKEYVEMISYRLEKDRKRLARAQQDADITAAAPEKPWKLKSLWLNYNPTGARQGQVVSFRQQNQKLLWGTPQISDRIGTNKYVISPLSFFQVNPIQTEKLYDTVRDFALGNLTPAQVAAMPTTAEITITSILDLYCGAGTIGLHLARHTAQLVGVESNEGAILDARKNAAQNGASQATFIAAKVEEVPRSEIPYHPTLVILDPPRKGSDPAMLAKILVLNPEKIIYVSCDPATLGRDIAVLTAGEYQIKAIQPVDMFPWTFHVETVVLMSRT